MVGRFDPHHGLDREELPAAMALYRAMVAARLADRMEMELVNRGEGYFHVGCAGHEAIAALNAWLVPDDWLSLHYRDKALMIARGLPVAEFFHSLICTGHSHSAGRQMSAHLSAPALHLLSLVGPVGNNALQAAGVAHEIKRRGEPGLVLCSVGDGASQEGEFLEAIAEAVRSELPVFFLIEDNHLAISTQTQGRTLFHYPSGPAADYYGLPIHRIDGRDPWGCRRDFGTIVRGIRQRGGPALAVLEVERLTHHTNADDERVYRPAADLERLRREADPVARLHRRLVAWGVLPADLEAIESFLESEVRAAAAQALAAPNPVANIDARPPLPAALVGRPETPLPSGGPRRTMLEAMRETLGARLAADPRVTVFGEDVEDPKGDVFGLTRGLSAAYPGRVLNTALTESTIAGVAIGRALAGGRPVGCIQFADFIPLAFNQIASEMGSMHWRTVGGWPVSAILMAPCGGYRPGLGPFHAQTFESVVAHIPGVDVFMPSTAADAAGLLNAAFETGRPTVFLYPKVCLNDPLLAAQGDPARLYVPPGKARRVAEGDALTLVTWGSLTPLCSRVAAALADAGASVDLWDLRSLSPWDADAIVQSVERTGRLLVVHEDNLTCGFGAEVVATVAERSVRPIRARRLTRPDTYVPCNYLNQLEVLPDFRRILVAASALAGIEVEWRDVVVDGASSGLVAVEATGSSPADQTIAIVEWKVNAGEPVEAGDLIADGEADKAAFEVRAPAAGIIQDLCDTDKKLPVGTVIARVRPTQRVVSPAVRRTPLEAIPRLRLTSPASRPKPAAANLRATDRPVVALSGFAGVPAGRIVTNEELAARFPGRTPADIFQRTGIETRRWLAPGESALTLATAAVRQALLSSGLAPSDLSAIWVSTSTPISLSPSMACLLHHQLGLYGPVPDLPASDLLAACTGYLYALQAAFDFCQARPAANVLVVTAEAMSEYIDPNDFDTAIVFGDASTATLVHGPESPAFGRGRILLHRPELSARGEDGGILNHGRREHPAVTMDGRKVFPMAVRQLIELLKQACATDGVAVENLDYIIPHQANGRILDAVDTRLKLPKGRLVNRVRHSGNTSSSTIPLVLADLLAAPKAPRGRAGLCAFGGGFTFGAALIEFV